MDHSRKGRYRDKINYITESLVLLKNEPDNELEKRGLFYSIQTTIEAIVDLVAMVLKDLGIEVKDDVENINKIVETFKIPREKGEKLKLANGMRNLLVHRYNGIDETIIMDSIDELKQHLMDWVEIVEKFLSEVGDDEQEIHPGNPS